MTGYLSDMFYDWNRFNQSGGKTNSKILIHDESLRDGLQSPSVVDPSVEDKFRILHLLDKVGVQRAVLGFPASSDRAYQHSLCLLEGIKRERLGICPALSARTVVGDIEPILEISDRVGIPCHVMTFIGSSNIRAVVEKWDRDWLVERTREAVSFAVRAGHSVTFITEDTTRSHPEVLLDLFKAALDSGAGAIALCDTVGYATPDGVCNLIGFTRQAIAQQGVEAKIEWHGHNDRGLALANAIAAINAGADCIHATVLGIGERTGNTPLDQLLIHLKLQNSWDRDLTDLEELCQNVSDALRIPIPCNYPGLGRDAFRTTTGVHAAAILKALAHPRGGQELADLIYSSVPASMLGRQQEVGVNHMSGKANVYYWFQRQGLSPKAETVEAILQFAKSQKAVIPTEVLRNIALQKGESLGILGSYDRDRSTIPLGR
ncbi:MAG: 2-isopropylmalate synthase [Cyanobacteria bacterium P01_E01_bin.42]